MVFVTGNILPFVPDLVPARWADCSACVFQAFQRVIARFVLTVFSSIKLNVSLSTGRQTVFPIVTSAGILHLDSMTCGFLIHTESKNLRKCVCVFVCVLAEEQRKCNVMLFVLSF